MKLELNISLKMTHDGENDKIRLSPVQKKVLGVHPGDRVTLTAEPNVSVTVSVDNSHSNEAAKDSSAAWVSQDLYDRLTRAAVGSEKVTLGCDPEFLFLDVKRRVLPASSWLPAKGFIGSDGPLAELRPSPAYHETTVVKNLKHLIRSIPSLTKEYFGSSSLVDIEGHSCWDNYALGFHIHVGIPKERTTGAAPHARDFLANLTTALDYFVGIPAMLLEDTNLRRLGDGAYGKPGDFRLTNKTIEYRTPGGFHLRHPDYAAGILGLALCVSKEALEDARTESCNWMRLNKCADFSWIKNKFNLPRKDKIKWALTESSKEVAVSLLPELVDNILNLRYFEDHSQSIRTYFKTVVENKQYSPKLLNNW